jgi:hypothetical protein
MILDASELPRNTTIDTDVCIVGAGTAGIVLAREFYLPANLLGGICACASWRAEGVNRNPETQSLSMGRNVGFPYFPLDTARARFFGGSSNRWDIPIGNERLGVRLRPFDPIDFEERDWVPHSGWPFSKAQLDSFYDRAQSLCGIEPATYNVRDWEDRNAAPKLPLNGDGVQTVIYTFGPRDHLARDYPRSFARGKHQHLSARKRPRDRDDYDGGPRYPPASRGFARQSVLCRGKSLCSRKWRD